MRTLSLSLRVTGDDDVDVEELNEAVDDDEQSFHQGPGEEQTQALSVGR